MVNPGEHGQPLYRGNRPKELIGLGFTERDSLLSEIVEWSGGFRTVPARIVTSTGGVREPKVSAKSSCGTK